MYRMNPAKGHFQQPSLSIFIDEISPNFWVLSSLVYPDGDQTDDSDVEEGPYSDSAEDADDLVGAAEEYAHEWVDGQDVPANAVVLVEGNEEYSYAGEEEPRENPIFDEGFKREVRGAFAGAKERLKDTARAALARGRRVYEEARGPSSPSVREMLEREDEEQARAEAEREGERELVSQWEARTRSPIGKGKRVVATPPKRKLMRDMSEAERAAFMETDQYKRQYGHGYPGLMDAERAAKLLRKRKSIKYKPKR